MACYFPTGITKTCVFAQGGVQKVYLTNREAVTAKRNPTTNIVTGFTMTGGQKFYRFEFENNTAHLGQELATGGPNKFVTQTLDFILAGMTQAKKEILEKVALANMTALVQYKDDKYVLAGIDGLGFFPATLSIDSGTAAADLNGVTISLTAEANGFANEVAASALTSLLS